MSYRLSAREMSWSRSSTRWVKSLLLASAIVPSVVLAQGTDQSTAPEQSAPDSADADDFTGDEIIVTARRRAENLQEVPISITAIGQEMLENLRVTNAEDLEILEPTFSVSPASGYANRPVYSLRGIRPTEAIYGQDPTVAVYFAEVVQSPSAGSNLGFYDLENVQILKGPQGTLFGRNTVGGAILLTPRRPGSTFSGNAMVGIGSYGLFETELGVDLPLADTFRVRLAGRAIESDGYQTNVAPGPLFGTKMGGEETLSARLTAVWDITEDIENTTIATYDDRDTNGRGTVVQAINPRNPFTRCYDGPTNRNGRCAAEVRAGINLPDIFAAVGRAQGRDVHDVEADLRALDNVSAWSIINTTTAKLNDNLTLKSILTYREVDTRVSFDFDAIAGADLLHIGPPVTGPQRSNLDHYSGELQLQGEGLDGRLDYVAGAYYYHEEGREYSPGSFFPALLPISPIEQDASIDNNSYSIFAQVSYELTDALTLTGGARMNWDERTIVLMNRTRIGCSLAVANSAGRLTPLPANQCALELNKKFSQPTGTVSLDYEVTPDILLYATSRLGYRSGGFNLRADIPAEYEPFDPETVIDAEVGAKTEWTLGGVRMRTNLAVYNQWYDDIQRTVAVENIGGSPGSNVVNAASAEVFGIELQQTIQPTDALTLQFSYTYIDPKYNKWIERFTGADLSETPFFFTPKHAGNATLNYEQPLAGDGGTVHFTANASYTDDVFINALHTIQTINQHPPELQPLLRQEDYWLVDLSAGWRDISGSGFDLLAYVRNVFDEEYKTGGVQLYTGATGFITAAFGPPRTYGVQLRYRF